MPPRKGVRHVLRLIRDVLFYQPRQRGTSLTEALDLVNRVLRRRSIVFLLSDFQDQDYEKAFKRAGRHHDLIAVRISDPHEEALPAVGLVEVEDAESGATMLLDTDHPAVRDAYRAAGASRREAVRELTRSAGCDLIEVSTDGTHLDALIRFFRMRERRQRRSGR